MKWNLKILFISACLSMGCANNVQQKEASIDVLSTDQSYKGTIGKTYAESKEWRKEALKAPTDAPDVIWILLDDVGYGAASIFGGLVNTPNLDKLSSEGLRYTNFHTVGVCAPSRAALLYGRNHHDVHMGLFAEMPMTFGFPGYDGRTPSSKGSVAENLREYGYNTYHLGKWDNTIFSKECTDLGPFDYWPSGKGFDHAFGFHGGETDQYTTRIFEDNKNIKSSGTHFTTQMTDKAIEYIKTQKELDSTRPYFMYYATGATHSPFQVDKVWIDKYKGKFDEGWDVAREKIFANQKKMGLIPADAKLPPREERVRAWNSLNADEKKVYARFMEAYAAYLEQTDFEIGRIINFLKQTGRFDNTAIFVMVGDNGGCEGGGKNGTIGSGFIAEKGDESKEVSSFLKRIDDIGTSKTHSEYPYGWSHAMNTPFKEWKTDANSEGGTRCALVVSYPKGIKDKGGFRRQYSHLNDILPTTLELIGIPAPKTIRGIKQDSIQGTSMVYSFNDANAHSRKKIQYYFTMGAGSIYKDGWKASFGYRPDFIDINSTYPKPEVIENNAGKEVWELYNTDVDFNELNNLSKSNPEKLKELQALFDAQAKANNVYPLINWSDIDANGKKLAAKK